MKRAISSSWLKLSLVILALYVVTHIPQLTTLPVFADEAIYIRWSQLIIDDWSRYAFFPLNDGKTPLHMWLMVPFQFLFSDQLYAGRFLSVLAGLAQVAVNGYLAWQLSGRKKTAWLAMVLTTILPFWYFHHRIALIDGLLTLWLSLTLVYVLKLTRSATFHPTYLAGIGLMFGLALWTKLPAVLFIPGLILFSCWPTYRNLHLCLKKAFLIGTGLGLGVVIFALMKLHPAFGQLFSRGSDFLYPWQEVILGGLWRQTVINFPTYVTYFVHYLTFPLGLLILAGLFAPSQKRTIHLLFWAGIAFILPIAILGKVVYPRYLFPASLFFTLAGALSLQAYVDAYLSRAAHLYQKVVVGVILALLVANTVATSAVFIYHSLWSPNTTPLVEADKGQYLYEWSSGHGIKETVELLKSKTANTRVAVGTEGYFGTLPDGLILYFHRRSVDNLYIDGIGYPIDKIPATFAERAREFDQVWVVVNSHRLKMVIPQENLIAEFCRPDGAPCLQVWDVTTHEQLRR